MAEQRTMRKVGKYTCFFDDSDFLDAVIVGDMLLMFDDTADNQIEKYGRFHNLQVHYQIIGRVWGGVWPKEHDVEAVVNAFMIYAVTGEST